MIRLAESSGSSATAMLRGAVHAENQGSSYTSIAELADAESSVNLQAYTILVDTRNKEGMIWSH